jgi:hypothetical protein
MSVYDVSVDAYPPLELEFALVPSAVTAGWSVVTPGPAVTMEYAPAGSSASVLTVFAAPLEMEWELIGGGVLATTPGAVHGLLFYDGVLLGGVKKLLTAADLDPSVTSGAAFSGCRVERTASYTITDESVDGWQALAFTAEDYDTDAYHDNSTNSDRVTVPSGKAGKFTLMANVQWDNGSTSGLRKVRVRLNGSTVVAQCGAPGTVEDQQIHLPAYQLAVGDYLTVEVWQNSGADRFVNRTTDWSPSLVFWRLGD